MEDISVKGAFLAIPRRVEFNQVVGLTIDLTATGVKAKVIRVTGRGIGLQFEKTLSD
jgi:hypothetical protein